MRRKYIILSEMSRIFINPKLTVAMFTVGIIFIMTLFTILISNINLLEPSISRNTELVYIKKLQRSGDELNI